jgi:hypothetical protein
VRKHVWDTELEADDLGMLRLRDCGLKLPEPVLHLLVESGEDYFCGYYLSVENAVKLIERLQKFVADHQREVTDSAAAAPVGDSTS